MPRRATLNATLHRSAGARRIHGGLSAQEIPDINRLQGPSAIWPSGLEPSRQAVGAGRRNLWRALQDSTNFRESLFRYAAYLSMQRGDRRREAAARTSAMAPRTLPKIVDAVEDPADKRRAARPRSDRRLWQHLGRRLADAPLPHAVLVVAGDQHPKRYWRLTANAFTSEQGRGASRRAGCSGHGVACAARRSVALHPHGAGLPLLYLWNRLLHGDDEDKLDDRSRSISFT
jgi:hypothetical protein